MRNNFCMETSIELCPLEIVISGGTKTVADPGFGDDVGRFFGTFDLLAQLADVNPQILGLIGVGAPHGVKQSTVRENLAGMLCQIHQQIELLGCRVRILPANDDAVLWNV